MLNFNLDSYFPELAGLPPKVQQDIVEQARYQTFTTVKGSNSKFVWRFFGVGVLSLIAAQVISHFTELNNTLMLSVFGGLGAVLAIHWQQKSWAKHMRPQVKELAKRYRSGEN